MFKTKFFILMVFALIFWQCNSEEATGDYPLDDETQAAIDEELQDASGKADGFGLFFYKAEYWNSAISLLTADGEEVALVAGHHTQDFPYYHEKAKWDNILLYIDGQGYHVTDSEVSGFLIDDSVEDTIKITFFGTIYNSSNEATSIEMELTFNAIPHDVYQLGKQYNFLDIEEVPGMRWQPFSLILNSEADNYITIDGNNVQMNDGFGEIENGIISNLQASDFAFHYDYFSASSVKDHFAYVNFTGHSLFPDTAIGKAVDWYATNFASEELTLAGDDLEDGNEFGVILPSAEDHSIVVATDTVDLGLALLDRELIRFNCEDGKVIYGLREQFHAQQKCGGFFDDDCVDGYYCSSYGVCEAE